MPKSNHELLKELRTEHGRLLAGTKELSQLARQWVPKWNRLSNGGKFTIINRQIQFLRLVNKRVFASMEKAQSVLNTVDRAWEVEVLEGEEMFRQRARDRAEARAIRRKAGR